MNQEVITVGRFYAKNSDAHPSLERFARAAALATNQCIVAVNIDPDHPDHDEAESLMFLRSLKIRNVSGLGVRPWQRFVPALNALGYEATKLGYAYMLVASTEFPPIELQVDELFAHMDDDTFMVGARMPEHRWQLGENEGTGLTVPWNTFNLINLYWFARLGIPLGSDMATNPRQAGVEEVATLALAQSTYSVSQCQAKLVQVTGIHGWQSQNTESWDEDRLAKHRQKMELKESRPAVQLEYIGLKPPTVLHVGQ